MCVFLLKDFWNLWLKFFEANVKQNYEQRSVRSQSIWSLHSGIKQKPVKSVIISYTHDQVKSQQNFSKNVEVWEHNMVSWQILQLTEAETIWVIVGNCKDFTLIDFMSDNEPTAVCAFSGNVTSIKCRIAAVRFASVLKVWMVNGMSKRPNELMR